MVFSGLTTDAVNRAVKTLDGFAGKGVNVAKVLKMLGEEAVFVGFLGGARGENLRRVLQSMEIAVECQTVEAQTRECVTVINQKDGSVTELVEESKAVPDCHYEALLSTVKTWLSKPGNRCQAVTLSGTITPEGPVDFYYRCTELAHAAHTIAVVDAKGPVLERALAAKPDLVKPNRTELAATLGYELADEQTLLKGMRALHERGAARVIVTAGACPTLAFDGRKCWRIKAPTIHAVNPIGSGDSFTAGVTSRLIRGDDLGEACRWGCAAGTANALTLMAGELNRADVERLQGAVGVELVST
jgi:tagatose 6-phosphate kinase